jgi:hypothetical protein
MDMSISSESCTTHSSTGNSSTNSTNCSNGNSTNSASRWTNRSCDNLDKEPSQLITTTEGDDLNLDLRRLSEASQSSVGEEEERQEVEEEEERDDRSSVVSSDSQQWDKVGDFDSYLV